jgi:hypothetical protein
MNRDVCRVRNDPRNSQGMAPGHRFTSIARETLILKCIGILLLAALLGGFVWVQATHEAAAFNRLTTGPKVTTWDAVWLDLRVEAQ